MAQKKTIVFFPPKQLSRIIVLGTGPLLIPIAGFAIKHSLRLEVFMGPRQAGNLMEDGSLVIKRLKEMKIPIFIEEEIREIQHGPYKTADDQTVMISFGSPYIIRQDLIDLYEGRVINTHGSPLPEWRGAGGFSWRILAGDRRGRSCYHLLTAGIDEGDIILQRSYVFPPEARYPAEWMDMANREEEGCLLELLQGFLEGREFFRNAQDESEATYFPRLNTPSQAFIDWSWQGEFIERFVLAFSYPYEGAKTFVGDSKVHILDCVFQRTPAHPHPFFEGLIFRIFEAKYYVCVNGGTVVFEEKHLRTERPLRLGDRLYTPVGFLEQTRLQRAVFTPSGLKSS